jgi:hypothetical protein
MIMKKVALLLAAGSAVISGGTMAASVKTDEGEAKLAKMLEGRVAGEPQSCISAHLGHRLEIIEETALVYDAGSTIYVARPRHPNSLDDDDILVIKRTGSRLCNLDVMRTVDRSTGMTTGIVFLNDFVPYRRS